MNKFTLDKVTKLGDFDEKYGQTYWAETTEQLEPLKFNSLNQDIGTGDTITAEERLLKTSSKGTEYHQLRKVKIETKGHTESPQTPQTGDSSIKQQLDRIESKIDRLIGDDSEPEDYESS